MFRIDGGELKRVLGLLGRFVAKRAAVPALSCVRVCWTADGVEWTATDLAQWLTVVVHAERDGLGEACVPHRLLADIAGKVGGVVEFAQDGEQVLLLAGKARFRLNAVPAEEYPERPKLGQELVCVPANALSQALRRVAPCCAGDYSRPVLTAVCWDGEVMVATDGTRMGMYRGVLPVDRKLLLSGQASRAMAGMLPESGEVRMFRGADGADGLVGFYWAEDGCKYGVVMRQSAASYPDWRHVVPAGGPAVRAVLEREALAGALQRLATLGREELPSVAMHFGDGTLVLRSSSEAGTGEEEIECDQAEGGPVTVRANAGIVLGGLRLAESQTVELRGWGMESIQEIREAGNEAWRYLWLPLRGGK